MNRVSMSEQSAIGCIILDPKNTISAAMDILKADDFQHPLNQQIFEIAAELFTMGKTIDVVTILHKLGNQPEQREYLVSCAQLTPSTTGFKAYFEAVKENSRRQKALGKTAQLLTALTEGDDLADCQSLAVEASEALNSTQHNEAFTAKQGILDFYTSKMKQRSYIKTGIERLDKYTYIDKGDYIIVGGRPSSGKTALTLQIMLNMAKAHNVVYFSLETSKEKIFDRLISFYTMTAMEEIKRQQINDWGKIAQAADRFGLLKFTVVQAAGWTVAQIAAKSVQLGQK